MRLLRAARPAGLRRIHYINWERASRNTCGQRLDHFGKRLAFLVKSGYILFSCVEHFVCGRGTRKELLTTSLWVFCYLTGVFQSTSA